MGVTLPSAASLSGDGTTASAGSTREALRLLLQLATGAPPPQPPLVDWAALLALARAERCVGLAWMRSRRWLEAHAPSVSVAAWRVEVARLDDGSRRQLAGYAPAVRLLVGEGVSCVVLKGAPLAQRLYGDPFVRHSADVDLYVPLAQRELAHDLLLGAGWNHDGGAAPGEAFYRTAHEGLHLLLEVHSSLTDDPLLSHLTLPEPKAQDVPVADVVLPAFAGPLLPAYLALHLAKHTSAPLLWLLDFSALWSQLDESGRSAALAAAESARVARHLQWCVRRCALLKRAAEGDDAALVACGGSTRLFREPHAAWLAAGLAGAPADALRVLGRWLVRRAGELGQAPSAARGRLAWLDRIVGRARRRKSPGWPPNDTRVVFLNAPHSLALVRDVLSRGGEAWLVARGTSMWPSIPHGARVCVRPLGSPPHPGDVVLAEAALAEPVLHRVESVAGDAIVLRGDNMPRPDRPIPPGGIIGLAIGFEHNGVRHPIPPGRPGTAVRYMHRARQRLAAIATPAERAP